jgi:hypothetical protein
MAFLEDGLNFGKFEHVKTLRVPDIDTACFYAELLCRTASFLEELALGIESVKTTGPKVWSALEGLSRLKKLTIVSYVDTHHSMAGVNIM